VLSGILGWTTGPLLSLAQEATPGTPEPGATPASLEPCGPLLGIGDASVACVIFVQTVADARSVDLLIDGTAAVTELPFAATSGFLPLAPSTYAFEMTLSGDSANIVAELPELMIESGTAYEVVAVGLQQDGTARFEILPVDLSPVGQGEVRIRVYHAIANGQPIDLAKSDGGEIMMANVQPLSATDYFTLDARSVALEARSAGSEDTLVALGTETLEPDMVVSLYLVGSAAERSTPLVVPIVIALSGAAPVGMPNTTPVATPRQ
jgi:hypothetical protein